MVIDSAYVGMESARLYTSSTSTRVSSAVAIGGSNTTGGQLSSFTEFLPKDNDSENEKNGKEVKKEDNLSNALNKMGGIKSPNYVCRDKSGTREAFRRLREMCIRHIFDMLFGHGVSNKDKMPMEEIQPGSGISYTISSGSYHLEKVTIETSFESTFSESESTQFTTQGLVKTADGREISFDINVAMSRSFTSTLKDTSIYSAMQAIDPLVINLDVGTADIGDQNFYFDLDCDGEEEELTSLGKGSGFLALDKNNDGFINDGSELFGTSSGDGFADLAKYDSDGNGWIDEKDEVFKLLKIWTKDENGNDVMYSLKDKNVGAIYLGSRDTEFSLTRGSSMEAEAIIRKTGMFLYEDGNVGTIQHVDLVS